MQCFLYMECRLMLSRKWNLQKLVERNKGLLKKLLEYKPVPLNCILYSEFVCLLWMHSPANAE